MDFLTNPDKFMERQKDKGFLLPIILVAVAATISSLTAYVATPYTLEFIKQQVMSSGAAITESQMEAMLRMVFYSMVITPFIATFIIWLIASLILHVISGIFGGSGNFSTLAKLVAYSHIPPIILSPVTVYLAYESSKYIIYGMKSYLVPSTTLQIAIVAWQTVYWTYAVKNARNLDLRKSAITALIVFIAYLLLTASSLIFSFLSATL
ncbi:YIP1 family protein [Archaeoglobus sp.]